MDESRTEIEQGNRFAFGANWREFSHLVDADRIASARASLIGVLGADGLEGRRFLDAGCGSGLFSLAARELGAQVVSFDFDGDSVATTAQLHTRFRPDDAEWRVLQGSVLDATFLAELGTFDVVYSWGVLHHTGDMWRAMDLCSQSVRPGGLLFQSIYNDQGWESRGWRAVKRHYNRSGPLERRVLVGASVVWLGKAWPIRAASRLEQRVTGGAPNVARPSAASRTRGMSRRHDLLDWVGGYPFQVAKPEQVFDFLRARGFELRHLTTCAGGIGCNEFLFERTKKAPNTG